MYLDSAKTLEACGKESPFLGKSGSYIVVCLRVKGHDGACETAMGKAAVADGLRPCCHAAISADHAKDCYNVSSNGV